MNPLLFPVRCVFSSELELCCSQLRQLATAAAESARQLRAAVAVLPRSPAGPVPVAVAGLIHNARLLDGMTKQLAALSIRLGKAPELTIADLLRRNAAPPEPCPFEDAGEN